MPDIRELRPVPEKQTVTFFIRNLPKGLHTLFKAKCAMNNTNMRDCVVALMRKYVTENK